MTVYVTPVLSGEVNRGGNQVHFDLFTIFHVLTTVLALPSLFELLLGPAALLDD